MAKWGEGDARWIVQDRKDGANVNGWHWEEKNRMHWVKQRIPELLGEVCAQCPSKEMLVRVKEVSKIDGHAYVAMRKGGKKLGVYDLCLEVKWEAPGEKDGELVEGTLNIKEFATESDEEDWMIECTTTSAGKHATLCEIKTASECTRLMPVHVSLQSQEFQLRIKKLAGGL